MSCPITNDLNRYLAELDRRDAIDDKTEQMIADLIADPISLAKFVDDNYDEFNDVFIKLLINKAESELSTGR